MKTKSKKASSAALKPLVRVVLTSHTAGFFRCGEHIPYSVLGYGAPGSEAHAKAGAAIRELEKGYKVFLEGDAATLKAVSL